MLQPQVHEDVSMRLLKESLGGGGGDRDGSIGVNKGGSGLMDPNLSHHGHGSDGNRRRNRSGGNEGFGRGNRGGMSLSDPREGHQDDAFSDRNNPFGGVGPCPDFNQISAFGNQFPSAGTQDKWNPKNRGGDHRFSGQHGGIYERQQQSDGNRGSEFGLGPISGGTMIGEAKILERSVSDQGQRNWAGPGNDRPPFWNWDQGCNASGSQLKMGGRGSVFDHGQPHGRGRGPARSSIQPSSRGSFNTGGIDGGKNKYGQFEGNDGRNEFDPEQRIRNMRGEYDNKGMGEFQRIGGSGEGFSKVPDGMSDRSGHQSSDQRQHERDHYLSSGPLPQQTRPLQVPDQDRRSYLDGHKNRPSLGPSDHRDNERHQSRPLQRPNPHANIGNLGPSQPSSHHSYEQIGGSRDGLRDGSSFGQIRAASGPDGSHQISMPQTRSGSKGSWPHQGGTLSKEGDPRQSDDEWNREGPAFNRNRDPQRDYSGVGNVNVGGQRQLPWNQRDIGGPLHSRPISQRPTESGSSNYLPGLNPFGGSEQPRAHLHQGVNQQLRTQLPGSELGNRGFVGHQGLGRPAHSEAAFNQSNIHGINHPPQDVGPSSNFSGHATEGNIGPNWNRGVQPPVQKKDTPSESMQDLIKRSKQFQSQKRQSPDREQFMNPPNPNATPPSGGSGAAFNISPQGTDTTSSVVTDSSGAPAPDYKALLQYLQFYQKQMGGANTDK